MNIYNYSNEVLDKELADGSLKVSKEERRPHYVNAQKILIEDLPMVPLSEMMIVTPYYSYIKGHPLSEEAIANTGYKEYNYIWLDK